MGKHWTIIHVVSRNVAYTPQLEDGGPELSTLIDTRITYKTCLNGHTDTITDDWTQAPHDADGLQWMGSTHVLTSTSVGRGDVYNHPIPAVAINMGVMVSSRPWDAKCIPHTFMRIHRR